MIVALHRLGIERRIPLAVNTLHTYIWTDIHTYMTLGIDNDIMIEQKMRL